MLKDCWAKYEVRVPDNFEFSQYNLVIGKNGSGKTRLLKGYRDYCQENKGEKDELIYIYFPALSAKYEEKFEEIEVESTLFDIINNGEDMSYDEFVTLFQYTGVSLVKSYLNRLKERGNRTKDNAKKTLQRIENNLEEFLNIKLILGENDIIFKFSNGKKYEVTKALSIMSPGEINLFYITLFLSITSGEKNYILLMDEPELHVHPSAVIKFYKAIRAMSCIKELWIATHSPLLLQEFSFNEIVLLTAGVVQPRNSHLYENIMKEMLGDNQKAISELFRSLEEWDYCNFIAECFSNPTVVEKACETDEQAVKLAGFCRKMAANSVKILDWGGGAGRLGKCLELISKKSKAMPKYRYEIYEPFWEDTVRDQEFKTYRSVKQITEKYDFVVLMNVLHEISVKEWRKIFEQIKKCLKFDGYLIFAEAKVLRIGEQPYCDNGYLVLNERQIKELFKPIKGNEKICSIHTEMGREDKSEFIIIPADELGDVTDAKIRSALKCLKHETFRKLRTMDKERINCAKNHSLPSFTYRKYAFVAQQYVNASLVLESEFTFNNAMQSDNYARKQSDMKYIRITEPLQKNQKASMSLNPMEYISVENRTDK